MTDAVEYVKLHFFRCVNNSKARHVTHSVSQSGEMEILKYITGISQLLLKQISGKSHANLEQVSCKYKQISCISHANLMQISYKSHTNLMQIS